MKQVRSQDGTLIAFDQYGEGLAVILVGGAFQHRAIDPSTAELAARLGAHFTVVHYDRRGRGDSGDTAPYAAQREIEDLEALIDAAGGSAFVFGMSSGSALALDAANQLGDKIKKLAVYEPPFIVNDERPPVPEEYLARITELIAAGRRGDAVAYFMVNAVVVPEEFVIQMRQEPFWPTFEAVAHTLPYDAALMEGTMFGKALPAERWASVVVPTLVMDGGASPAYMHSGAQALVDTLPNGQRRTLKGQTHEVASEVLAPVLRAFFAS
jgi:pimeloyl-ACP methyl ester carboxylesterase